EDRDELPDPATGAVHLDHHVEHVASETGLTASDRKRTAQHVYRLGRLALARQRLPEIAQRGAEGAIVARERFDELAVLALGALELAARKQLSTELRSSEKRPLGPLH